MSRGSVGESSARRAAGTLPIQFKIQFLADIGKKIVSLFKECLKEGVTPFIITEDIKLFYYRGLQSWPAIPGYLRDTCLTAQDSFTHLLKYFRIPT